MGGNSSSTGMAALGIAIAHKHTIRFKEQGILTSRAVFAYRLPRIGILSGGNVGGGGDEYAISLSLFLYINDFFVAMQACFHLVGVTL